VSGRGEGWLVFIVDIAQWEKMKSSVDGGSNGCMIRRMGLMLWNRALEMVKMLNFMSCAFYHSLERLKKKEGKEGVREEGGKEA
jgi:hypothetical protein